MWELVSRRIEVILVRGDSIGGRMVGILNLFVGGYIFWFELNFIF